MSDPPSDTTDALPSGEDFSPEGQAEIDRIIAGVKADTVRRETTIHESREERTLRAMFLIARRLYGVTNDSRDWQSVILIESLINECVKEGLNDLE